MEDGKCEKRPLPHFTGKNKRQNLFSQELKSHEINVAISQKINRLSRSTCFFTQNNFIFRKLKKKLF